MQRYEVLTSDGVETSDTEDITPSNKHSTHYQSQKFIPLSLQHVLLWWQEPTHSSGRWDGLLRCNLFPWKVRLLFVHPISHRAGGIPLAVAITSDEKQDTMEKAFDMIKQVLPEEAFFGKGAATGPSVFLTDDSKAERGALHTTWPNSQWCADSISCKVNGHGYMTGHTKLTTNTNHI